MAARLAALLPRLVALTVIWLLATSTWTLAAANRKLEDQQATPPLVVPTGPKTLVVPDVRRQAYVFAKGILEDAGFSWRVRGSVDGYAANLVATQAPAPGTSVVDTGSPTIVLRLERNPDYAERGLPENVSPYAGTAVELAPSEAAVAAEPAPAAPAEKPKKKKKKEQEQHASPPPAPQPAAPEKREPDFEVPGAPPEPQDEMPLPDRALLLDKRVRAHAKPTKKLVNYWLYQHAWVVTGAKFGWSGGAEALRTLVALDEEMQARWGIGARSAAVARAALAEVESHPNG